MYTDLKTESIKLKQTIEMQGQTIESFQGQTIEMQGQTIEKLNLAVVDQRQAGAA